MNDGSRFFAYSTWVIMISLAVIVLTNNFLIFITDPGWIGLAALLAYGLVYLNFSYIVNKRFIRKVFTESRLHYLLALLIFLPPAVWGIFVAEDLEGSRFIFTMTMAFACWLGAFYGHRSGRREQSAYLKKQQT